jgi:hypothetical protein
MSNNSFHVESCWGPRQEDIEICAERLTKMLGVFARIHPAFAHWYYQGDTRADANRPFCTMPPRIDELTQILKKNMDEPGFPQLGYWVHPWNGRDDSYGIALETMVGKGRNHPLFPNDVNMQIHAADSSDRDFVNYRVMKTVLLAIATIWNPDWGGIAPPFYAKRWARKTPWPGEPVVKHWKSYYPPISAGWMTYLCADYARRITRPPGIEVEPVITGGCLLIATEETFDPDNPAHYTAADAIQDALLPLQHLPYQEGR